ncbi:MAG: helix-turn-helix domain-containing protein [Solobacterium sp.]|nr:helix-turn-helix domain-containing protein [Solobacterium sp.]
MGRKPGQTKINREQFNYALKRKGLTQEVLGEKIGYSREAISAVVNQRRGASRELLDLICRELDVHPDYLTGENDYYENALRIAEAYREDFKKFDGIPDMGKALNNRIDPQGYYIRDYLSHTVGNVFEKKEEALTDLIKQNLLLNPFLNQLSEEEKKECITSVYMEVRDHINWMINSALKIHELQPYKTAALVSEAIKSSSNRKGGK